MSASVYEVLAISYLLSLSIIAMTIFNNAVIGGGETIVSVVKYGEMVPELLLLNLVIWPVVSVGLYHWHHRNID